MKTLRLSLFTVVILLIFASCSNSDDNKGLPTLELAIVQETAQDQIEDFACNAMAIHENKIWSVGGASNTISGYNSSVWSSTNGVAWISVANNIVGERCGHTLTTFNSELWLIGGENNDGDWYADVWHSTDGSTWVNNLITAPFGEVAFHNTLVYNNKMYVIAADADIGFTKVWSTANGDEWVEETSNAFAGIIGQKGVVFNDAMYLIGGENVAGDKRNDIWTSTNGATWSLLTNNTSVFPGINKHTATVYNNKVWIVGGRTNTADYSNTIYYSENLQDWTKYEGVNPIEPIASHSALHYNDGIWVFGGYVSFETPTGSIWSVKED